MQRTPFGRQPPFTRDERVFQRWFVVLSAVTVLLGTVAMVATGASSGLWLRNPACWVVALAMCAGLVRLRLPPAWVPGMLVVVLAGSLVGPGQDGVHRWLGIGPVQVNVAALIMPFVVVLAARRARHKHYVPYAVSMLAMAAILARQPDMSQLGALVAALLLWAAVQRKMRALVCMVPIAVAILVACAGVPDPLAPVPYVEKILDLAWSVSPALALFCGVSLLLTSLSPLILAGDTERRPGAVALSAYFVVSGVAWLFGFFPVPLAGYGLGFVLGWMFGAAALVARD